MVHTIEAQVYSLLKINWNLKKKEKKQKEKQTGEQLYHLKVTDITDFL